MSEKISLDSSELCYLKRCKVTIRDYRPTIPKNG